jgi:DNA-binding LacI/PurR family transcriptional regulator
MYLEELWKRSGKVTLASLKTISLRTKTSQATVSRALNDHPEVDPETRRRILEAAEEVGYRRPIDRRNDTLTIGVLHTSRSGFYEYDTLLAQGMMLAVTEHRFDILWLDMHRDKAPSESYAQFLRRKNVRGVVLRAFGDSRHVVEAVADEGIAAVTIGERFDRPDINWVRIDGKAESRHAVEHLINLGHRRIGLVTHSRQTNDHQDREAGYRTAMAAAGLPIDENLVIRIKASAESGAAAINRLVSLPSPTTAVYITDPPTAVGAINRCHELKLGIPEDISIVGFDDDETRNMTWPRFSAVCQATRRLGYEAALWLTRQLTGIGQPPLHLELPACFEVLSSTGVRPATATRVLPDGTRIKVDTEEAAK